MTIPASFFLRAEEVIELRRRQFHKRRGHFKFVRAGRTYWLLSMNCGSEELRRDVERHRVFPTTVCEHAFATAIGVHDENLTVLLEGVVV